MLDQETIKARVQAARVLRGLTQTDLGAKFKEDGLGKHDPGRIERGELPMQRAHRVAFMHHLRLPDKWFSDPETDNLIAMTPPPSVDEVVAATLRRLGVRVRQDPPGRLGRLDGADPTSDEGRQEEEPPQAGDAQ